MRDVAIAISLALVLVGCEKPEKKHTPSDDEPARSSVSASAKSSSASAPPPRGEPPPGWSLLRPAGDGYSVFVPGAAEKLDGGLSDLWAVKRANGVTFMAMCFASEQPDAAFTGMRRGKIGERKLLSAKPVDDARGKGERLAVELETNKGILVSNDLLLIGKHRVCSFTALVPASVDEKADVERFFDSARLEE